MSVRIAWAPSPDNDIASYDVEKGPSASGPWGLLANIPHVLTGPNYDALFQTFFYVDNVGVAGEYYRLTAIDAENNRSDPTPAFLAVVPAPAINAGVAVNHNYPSNGFLRYQAPSGVPVENATVRIWRKIDFDTGNTSNPIGATTTNASGNWVSPIILSTGYTYVVQFHKESLYGPDIVEVSV